MSARKFITVLPDGRQKLASAIITSAGSVDQFKIPAVGPNGRLHLSFMPEGVGANTLSKVAFEGLAAGDLVEIFDDAGTPSVRKSDAGTNRRVADGFVLEAVTTGNVATVYLAGSNITGLTGLTVGAFYFLSNSSPGGLSATPPDIDADIGHIVQRIGKADSPTSLLFEPDEPIEVG